MRTIQFIIALSIITAGCSEDDPNGGCVAVDKALKQVASLENIVEKGIIAGRPDCTVYKGARIFACVYKGERTYYLSNGASSMATCVFIAYDCHGDEIINFGTDSEGWNTFYGEQTEEELLWTKM